jgi:hypothetical protein
MRKYILSSSVLGAVFGAAGIVKQTTSGPRDWRLILLWVAWGINVTLAVTAVADAAKQAELEQ